MSVIQPEIRNWTIYKILSPSNRIYVGVTCDIKQRFRHYRNLYPSSQKLLYRSLAKYGYGSHSIEIIESFKSTIGFAHGKEIFWIRSYMSNRCKYPEQNGMNMTDGGQGTIGYKMTNEQRVKLGDRVRGFRHTDEAKRRIGDAAKGNKYGKGYKWSEKKMVDMKERMMGNKFGKGPSENNKAAIRASAYKKRIPILQYDKENNFIKEHFGVLEAQKELGINNISGVLTGKLKHTAGFIFKYKQI